MPRAEQEATVVLVRTDEGITGVASGGDGLPDRALLERLLVGRRPAANRDGARDLRDGRLPRRAAVGGRGGGLGRRRRGARRSRSGSSSAVAASACSPTRRAASPSRRRSGRAVRRARGARRARRQAPLPRRTTGAPTSRSSSGVREAVGDRLEIMVDANQGWRMPGDRAPRWDVATATSARGRSSSSTSTGSRSRSAPTTTTATRRCAPRPGLRIAAGELVRDAAEARDLALRGLVDVVQADVLFVGGLGGLPADRRARRPPRPRVGRRTRGRTASGSSRTSTARSRSRPCPYVEVPYDPPALVAGAARLAAPGRARDRCRRHGRAARRARPRPRRSTSTALERWRIG